MESATPSSEPAASEQELEISPEPDTPTDYSTPLLEALFTGSDRRYQATGSLIYGILGVTILAIVTSAMGGSCLAWADQHKLFENVSPLFSVSAVLMLAAMIYPTGVLVLQLLASLRLPLALRLLLIYATLYACLRSVTFGIHTPIDGASLLFCAPICLGGFIQHRFGGWNAVGWSQTARPPSKLSIASLLDLTAAIAITMGVASTTQFNPAGLACLLPTFLVLAVLGMHPWARLVSLCDDKEHRDTGFALWMVGNVMWGCGVFLLIAMYETGMAGLMALVTPPLVILIAHYYTALPLAWLRACGWKFVRAESHSRIRPDPHAAIFNSSI